MLRVHRSLMIVFSTLFVSACSGEGTVPVLPALTDEACLRAFELTAAQQGASSAESGVGEVAFESPFVGTVPAHVVLIGAASAGRTATLVLADDARQVSTSCVYVASAGAVASSISLPEGTVPLFLRECHGADSMFGAGSLFSATRIKLIHDGPKRPRSALVSARLLAAGCSRSAAEMFPPYVAKAPVLECFAPEDCSAFQTCLDAACVPRACSTNDDCTNNAVCDEGFCVDPSAFEGSGKPSPWLLADGDPLPAQVAIRLSTHIPCEVLDLPVGAINTLLAGVGVAPLVLPTALHVQLGGDGPLDFTYGRSDSTGTSGDLRYRAEVNATVSALPGRVTQLAQSNISRAYTALGVESLSLPSDRPDFICSAERGSPLWSGFGASNNRFELTSFDSSGREQTIDARAVLDARNGVVPLISPRINADFHIRLRFYRGHLVAYAFGGRHDRFPAYDLYIEGDDPAPTATPVYSYDPIHSGAGPLDLVDALGKQESVPMQDRWLTHFETADDDVEVLPGMVTPLYVLDNDDFVQGLPSMKAYYVRLDSVSGSPRASLLAEGAPSEDVPHPGPMKIDFDASGLLPGAEDWLTYTVQDDLRGGYHTAKVHVRVSECPIETPFFNADLGLCEECPPETPTWDPVLALCKAACPGIVQAGGDAPVTRAVELGATQGMFPLTWDHQNIKDRLVLQYEGATLFDTGCVGGTGQQSISYVGMSSVVIVSVIPNCEGNTSGTAWSFKVGCPQ